MQIDSTRISKISWHEDIVHSVVKSISKRVEGMTRLSTKLYEPLQIQLYGVGGYYGVHLEFTKPDVKLYPFKSEAVWFEINLE